MRRGVIAVAVTCGIAACASPAHAATTSLTDHDAYARVDSTRVTLGNRVAERRWSRSPFETVALVDKRAGGRSWSAAGPDFTLRIGNATFRSSDFTVQAVTLSRVARGGVRATIALAGGGLATGLSATRIAEVYPGIAGFRTQTVLTSLAAVPLSSATLDEAAVGAAVFPTVHAFRAGSDWRSPGWTGPPLWPDVGGDFRKDTSAGRGAAVDANGEWIDARAGQRRLFIVMERNDLPSSRAGYDSHTAAVRVDYTKDVIDLGPFEEQIHVENPAPNGGRTRTLEPGRPFALEPSFIGLGTSGDDGAWQWQHYLSAHRIAHWTHDVAFNTNNIDSNRISTGAKDDADLAAIKAVAPIARDLGVTAFVLDDGWQAASGDWYPDSPTHREPRGKFPPRFPDDHFAAVRRVLRPMKLGLWMSPLNFNPAARSYQQHPEWVCHPISDALAADNQSDPNSGSNEAGLPEWSTAGFAHVESRIRDAIANWGVRYFKFDFMTWLDCAGTNDFYQHHDAFLAMIDRLRRDFPGVTFQTDDTNDYRLFPFESTLRGPLWFQNGSPGVDELLHNLWVLSPYVPAYAIGQAALGGDSGGKRAWQLYPVGTLMAAALPSHLTFWRDPRAIPKPVVEQAARWVAFYKRNSGAFSLATFPLLADPLRDRWTALQEWDPDAQRGALLAFRQSDRSASTRIRLRLVRPGLRFTLREAPTGRVVGTVTSAELSHGLAMRLGRGGARVLLIDRAPRKRRHHNTSHTHPRRSDPPDVEPGGQGSP